MDPYRRTTRTLQQRPDGEDLSFNVYDPNQETQQANAGTPDAVQSAPVNYSLTVDESIPSTALEGGTTIDDVFRRREQLDVQPEQTPQYTERQDRFFDDPRQEILDIIQGGPTELELQEQELLDKQAKESGQFAQDIEGARAQAAREVGLGGLQDALSETQLKIARRQKRFREDLRQAETDAEFRGMARGFAESRRQKIESDAVAELADLAIIEAAQQGNLERAERFIETSVNEQYRVYEVERQARLDQLNALGNQITQEQQQEKQELELALADIAEQKEQDKEIRSLASQIAAEGAPNELVNRVMNAGSVEQALSFASPYIGLQARRQVESSLATASLNRRAKLVELALSGDESAFGQLGEFGRTLKEQMEIQRTNEEQEAFEQNINSGLALQSRISRYSEQLNNDIGISASTGALQSAIFSGLAGSGQFGEFDARPGGVFAIPGAINAKNDFLATVTEMVNIAGFDNLIAYKAAGATFGALSDSEFAAIKSASGPLAALAKMEEGRVTGFYGSEEAVRFAYQESINKLNEELDELNEAVLDQETTSEINQLTK